MPEISRMFPSRYLKGVDFEGKAVPCTIVGVAQEETRVAAGAKPELKWILYIRESEKGIVLSKTLAEQIAEALGATNTDKWLGRKVVLYPEGMRVAGVVRVAIRCRPYAERPRQAPKAAPELSLVPKAGDKDGAAAPVDNSPAEDPPKASEPPADPPPDPAPEPDAQEREEEELPFSDPPAEKAAYEAELEAYEEDEEAGLLDGLTKEEREAAEGPDWGWWDLEQQPPAEITGPPFTDPYPRRQQAAAPAPKPAPAKAPAGPPVAPPGADPRAAKIAERAGRTNQEPPPAVDEKGSPYWPAGPIYKIESFVNHLDAACIAMGRQPYADKAATLAAARQLHISLLFGRGTTLQVIAGWTKQLVELAPMQEARHANA